MLILTTRGDAIQATKLSLKVSLFRSTAAQSRSMAAEQQQQQHHWS